MLLASQYVSLKFIESESNNTATLTLTACALRMESEKDGFFLYPVNARAGQYWITGADSQILTVVSTNVPSGPHSCSLLSGTRSAVALHRIP